MVRKAVSFRRGRVRGPQTEWCLEDAVALGSGSAVATHGRADGKASTLARVEFRGEGSFEALPPCRGPNERLGLARVAAFPFAAAPETVIVWLGRLRLAVLGGRRQGHHVGRVVVRGESERRARTGCEPLAALGDR
jgi:hypothetical protein